MGAFLSHLLLRTLDRITPITFSDEQQMTSSSIQRRGQVTLLTRFCHSLLYDVYRRACLDKSVDDDAVVYME